MTTQVLTLPEVDAPDERQAVHLARRRIDQGAAIIGASLGAPEKKVRMWDAVDQTWTTPIPEYLAKLMYLDRVVFKCSACRFNDFWERAVEKHLAKVREKERRHVGAELYRQPVQNYGMVSQCTGCEYKALVHRERYESHLEAVAREVALHQGEVKELTMYHFSLRASEPGVLRERVLQGGVIELHPGAEASTVEGRQAPVPNRRGRHRRRRHSRGRTHDQ